MRTDLEIAQGLAKRIDALTGSCIARQIAGTHEDWKRRMLAKVESFGVSLERLNEGPCATL